MKYFFWLLMIALVIFLAACLFAQFDQVQIEQARAIGKQADAISTLSETIQTLADTNALALRLQAQQMQVMNIFLLLAVLAIGAETIVLVVVFLLILRERKQPQQQPQALPQPERLQALQPGQSLIMWPYPHYETANREDKYHEF